jgi:hypothetical protein
MWAPFPLRSLPTKKHCHLQVNSGETAHCGGWHFESVGCGTTSRSLVHHMPSIDAHLRRVLCRTDR